MTLCKEAEWLAGDPCMFYPIKICERLDLEAPKISINKSFYTGPEKFMNIYNFERILVGILLTKFV